MPTFHMPFLPPEALADEASIAATAERAVALARCGDARAGLNLALQARRQAQGLETPCGELAALNAAAMVHLIRGDAVAAVAAAIDARNLARRAGNRALLAQAVINLQVSAFILDAGGDVHGVLRDCTREALGAGDLNAEIRARVALGIVLGDEGSFDAASYEFARALRLVEEHGGPVSAARITANLANLHRKRAVAQLEAGYEARALRECDLAAKVARLACELAALEGSVSVEIDALAIAGCAADLRGDAARGRILLREAIALGRASRNMGAATWVLCEQGRMAVAAGDLAFEIASLQTRRQLE